MATRTPADLRERAAAVDAGMARSEVARAYRVHPRTLERWLARRRSGAGLADRPRSGRPPAIPAGQLGALREQVRATPDATLDQHRAAWAAATGVRVSRSAMGRAVLGLGLTLKKRP
jgi:transposase